MKRLFVLFVGLSMILFATAVMAQAKPEAAKPEAAKPAVAAPAAPAPAAPAAPAPAKEAAKVAKMSAAGKVVAISDTALKIERTVKDKVEAMDFTLEKAVADVKAGDDVKVSYVVKDGKNVATKVAKAAAKAAKKEAPAKEVKKDAPTAPAAPAAPAPAAPVPAAPAPAPAKK